MVAGIVKIFNLINAIEADPCCVACVFACNRNVANLNGPLCCLEALSPSLSLPLRLTLLESNLAIESNLNGFFAAAAAAKRQKTAVSP